MPNKKNKIVILGAAGRDFHNFNVVYRNDPDTEVIAFTANQIPDIAGRKYPPALAGQYYPNGIPILDEQELDKIIKENKVDECVLSYSDLHYEDLMHLGSRVIAAGAKFSMLAAEPTMLKSTKPVISINAVRTGCGKSQTTKAIVQILLEAGVKVVSVRHPMPYGNLEMQKVQRFAKIEDLAKHKCTIEEMEEYEPHIEIGSIIYSGVDYEAILREAEKEADLIIWEGGNNDTPFFKPDLQFVIVDPLRAGDEITYYPGEINLRTADVIIINKVNTARPDDIDEVRANIREYNPKAIVIEASTAVNIEDPDIVLNKNVLVIEDGPTLTHGDMLESYGIAAAKKYGAASFVDPRPWVVGKIAETFEIYPNIGTLLPAMGYSDQQVKDLETTINATECDSVLIGTPINLARFVKINKPHTRVFYEPSEVGTPNFKSVLKQRGFIK
ncbi:MAG: GTPase [Ignavibacteria bacterium]|nr:GTPase [Ignavibacteria bacterium]